ncbi:alpha-mannosidase [Cellulomonas sp. URHE0023]|uniref:alpha-mannosidase n=1 Tax=Cellulomonas sp. URHE0023 TaxID=1380354 RepID=UPI0009DFDDF0|nr:alpha-mannosidase [Cellulomonas sp. URHE0023]
MSNARAGEQPAAESGRPDATPPRLVHMIGNAHIDPVWLWPWQEGYQEARATFASVIARMDEYDDFVFTCDQMVLLSWVEESDPALFEQIRRRESEGRWVNVGGWWVEPDCNMPLGESFVRQGLYGQRFLLSRFGRAATVGVNLDPFGHSAVLPTILRGQGIDSYLYLRPGPHESDVHRTLLRWEAPDGSTVLAYRVPHEYSSGAGPVDGQVDKALAALDPDLGEVMVLYGVGNHGGGPTRANIESIHRYDRMGSFGRLRMAGPRDFFDGAVARDGIAARTGDLQHHAPGCYSAHSGIKTWQYRAQRALLVAERWAVVTAVTDGVPYPREALEDAWKHVLFNQFHDILPGTAVEAAFDDARDQLGAAVTTAKRVTARAHSVIARQVDIPFERDSQPVLVFNPHPWPVSCDVGLHLGMEPAGVVDDVGEPVRWQPTQSRAAAAAQGRSSLVLRADLPALGYRLYRVHRTSDAQVTATSLVATPDLLENDLVRIELDPDTGWLRSYLDKRTGIDVMAGVDGSTHTQVCADPTDTWGHRVVSYAWPGDAMEVRGSAVRELGPLRARVRVRRAWGASTMTEDLILDHDSGSLRVEVTLDWHEEAHLLKVRVPTSLDEPRATYEIPFASIERPVDGAEEPGQGWVDLTGSVAGRPAGLTILVTHKHGYDVSGGAQPSIGITAVRSPVYAWHDPYLLDPDGEYAFQDQGVQRFTYVLVPHAGDLHVADPTRRAQELGMPPRAMLESSHGGTLPPRRSFVTDEGGAVMITAVKGSEDATTGPGGADLVVRAVETQGKPAMGVLDLPLLGRRVEVPFGPFQLRTFAVPAASDAPLVELDLVERPSPQ